MKKSIILFSLLAISINCLGVKRPRLTRRQKNLTKAVKKANRQKIIELLKKENINNPNLALLNQAILMLNLDIIQFLLENGANINLIDYKKSTPLKQSLSLLSSLLEKTLLTHEERKRRVLIERKELQTDKIITEKMEKLKKIIGFLIDHGANIDQKIEHRDPKDVAKNLDKKFNNFIKKSQVFKKYNDSIEAFLEELVKQKKEAEERLGDLPKLQKRGLVKKPKTIRIRGLGTIKEIPIFIPFEK